MRERNPRRAELLLVVTLLGACGGGGGGGGSSSNITAVHISGPSSVVAGFPAQITATVSGTGSFDSSVDFSIVSGGGKLRNPQVGATGYLAPATPGSATIKATAHADPGHSDSLTLAITPALPAT